MAIQGGWDNAEQSTVGGCLTTARAMALPRSRAEASEPIQTKTSLPVSKRKASALSSSEAFTSSPVATSSKWTEPEASLYLDQANQAKFNHHKQQAKQSKAIKRVRHSAVIVVLMSHTTHTQLQDHYLYSFFSTPAVAAAASSPPAAAEATSSALESPNAAKKAVTSSPASPSSDAQMPE